MRHCLARCLVTAATATCWLALPSHAGVIDYAVAPLGGGIWRYDYSLTVPPLDFDQFTLYFDATQFQDLTAVSGPMGWDMLALEPDTALPADGLLDGLHLAGPLVHGATFTGFSVQVLYLGQGVPGPQSYDLLDSASLWVLQSGVTSPVPESRSALLLLLGMLSLGALGAGRQASIKSCPELPAVCSQGLPQ